ncbi:MAG: outer membrane protein heavy metal efflux system [Candidatus Binatota bacterium]|nr:outer membrane protein heavy metal efflux system [Candidatus Binatota bacterium]
MKHELVTGMLFGALLFGFCPARAETQERLRLSQLIEAARAANPAIGEAEARRDAAAAMPVQAAAWDDPVVTYEAWNAPDSLRIDHADNNILKLTQKIPFPGKKRLAGAVAASDADIARERLRAAELDTVAAVKRAFYTLWEAHRRLEILSRDEELVRRHATIAEDRYSVGLGAQPDVLRSQVEVTRVMSQIATEELAIESAGSELNALLSRPPEERLGVPEDPPPPRLTEDPTSLAEQALADRPELAARRDAVARAEAEVRRAWLDYLPDFELTLSRFVNHRSADGFGVMASATLPLVQKAKYDGAVSQKNARLAAARAALRLAEDRVRREVRQSYLAAKTALLQTRLFEHTHVPQAEQALESSEAAYQTGKVDFLSLTDSVRAIESIHLEHVHAAAEFQRTFADLERAVGRELAGEPAGRNEGPRQDGTPEGGHE